MAIIYSLFWALVSQTNSKVHRKSGQKQYRRNANLSKQFRFNWILHQYEHFYFGFFCRLFDFFVLIGQFYCESTIREMCEMASKRSHRRSKVSNVGVDKIFSILSIWIESSQPYWQNYRISICAIWIWDSFWPNTRKQQLNCRNLKLKVRNPIFLYIIWLNAMQFNSNVTFSVKQIVQLIEHVHVHVQG